MWLAPGISILRCCDSSQWWDSAWIYDTRFAGISPPFYFSVSWCHHWKKISVELLAFVTSWTHQWAHIVLLSFYLTPRKLIYMNYFVGALCHLKVENLRRKCRLNPKWKAYKIKRCEIECVFTCACVPKNRYLQELLKWKEWKEKERNTCWMNCSRKKHLRKMLMQWKMGKCTEKIKDYFSLCYVWKRNSEKKWPAVKAQLFSLYYPGYCCA